MTPNIKSAVILNFKRVIDTIVYFIRLCKEVIEFVCVDILASSVNVTASQSDQSHFENEHDQTPTNAQIEEEDDEDFKDIVTHLHLAHRSQLPNGETLIEVMKAQTKRAVVMKTLN